MKKLIATACVVGSVLALGACSTEGEGYVDNAPYAMERTAGGDTMAPAPQRSEQVFTRAQRK